jgi:hypothetical protein
MIDQLGNVSLFLGVETANWTLSDFTNAATKAKALGVTALLVKVADGSNRWYGALGGYRPVLAAIESAGISAVPYTYSYGDKFGGLSAEIALLTEIMKSAGIVVADMEVEWNGQAGWAKTLANALKPVTGLFGVTSWADPNQQNWQGVLQALAPATNFWLPQVYSNFLAGVYMQQYSGLPNVIPILNLGTDFGPNDIMTTAQNAVSPAICLWEYQAAIGPFESMTVALSHLKGGITVGVPAGWRDDGKTLTAPNGMNVVLGFRDYILSHPWDAGDWPLEAEHAQNPLEISNTSLGGGTQQVFRYSMLGWTGARGVFKEWMGQELLATRALKTPVVADAVNDLAGAIATLQDVQKRLSS